jgi:hypothetical protein
VERALTCTYRKEAGSDDLYSYCRLWEERLDVDSSVGGKLGSVESTMPGFISIVNPAEYGTYCEGTGTPLIEGVITLSMGMDRLNTNLWSVKSPSCVMGNNPSALVRGFVIVTSATCVDTTVESNPVTNQFGLFVVWMYAAGLDGFVRAVDTPEFTV